MDKHLEAEDPSSSGFLSLGKFLTIGNLRKRKVWILDWCYMCKCNDESLDHLFLRCLVAMDLRSLVLGLFGVSWVMPKSVVGLLACWQGWFGPPWNVHIWIIIPHCLMWCLWRERNCRCLTHTNNFGLVVCLAKPIILFYLWLSWFL